MKKIISAAVACIITIGSVYAQYPDTFEAAGATNYTIDGKADESHWAEATWYDIDNVWMPYGASMDAGDFAGRVKFAWTEERLLVFAEITDNELSDDHANPTQNYWDDDCLEVFIDEDRSGGDHTNNHQAFAYHCAIDGLNVADLGEGGGAILLNDHVDFTVESQGNNIYHWEMAILIYDDTYDEDGNNTPVVLAADKEMGLNMAYCDNDETSSRENFIGLVDVSEADFNSAYQTADAFGKLVLKAGSDTGGSTSITENDAVGIKLYPSIITDELTISPNDVSANETFEFQLTDLNGRSIYSEYFVAGGGDISINLSNIQSGTYIAIVKGKNGNFSQLVVKR